MTTIKKIVLKNFKSFKKSVIPLKKGFTAIIGPNGSGKSNILDALLFVTGITSTRLLRAGKLTDLITTNTREEYCSVELILSHKNKDYSIKRIVDRKAHSIFTLNDSKKNLHEITSFLNEIGIKSTGRNFTVQGDITAIVEKSPVERRELIDELAGLSEFDSKKSEALKELEKAEKKITQIKIALKEREQENQRLKQEYEEANKFLKLEKQKKDLKATILWLEKEKISEELNQSILKEQEIEEQLNAIEKKLNTTREKLEENEKEYEETTKKIFSHENKEFSEIVSRFEEQKAFLEMSKQKIQALQEDIRALEKRIIQNKKKQEELKKEKEKALQELRNAKEKLKEKKRVLTQLPETKKLNAEKEHQKFGDIKNELEKLRSQVNKTREEEIVFAGKIKHFTEKNLEKEQEKQIILKEISELEKQKKKIEKRMDYSIENTIKKTSKLIETTMEKTQEKKAEKKELEKTIKKLHETEKNCPVCTRQLPKTLKQKLLKETHSQKKEIEKQIMELEKKLFLLKQKKTETEKKIKEQEKTRIELEKTKNLIKTKQESIQKLEKTKHKGLEELKKLFQEKKSKKKELEKKLSLKEKEFEKVSKNISKIESTIKIEKTKTEITSLEKEINKIKNRDLKKIENEEIFYIQEITNMLNQKKEKQKKISTQKKEFEQIKENIIKTKKQKNLFEKEKEKQEKKRNQKYSEILSLREKRNLLENKIKRINETMQNTRVMQERLRVKHEDLEQELSELLNRHPETKINKLALLEKTKKEYNECEKKLSLIGDVNLKAEISLKQNFEQLKEIKDKISVLEKEKQAIIELMEKIEIKRIEAFNKCFQAVKKNFEEMFYRFFNGKGTLSLENPEDTLNSGLLIETMHTENQVKNIDALSGGEKTLTALAFLFALQLYESAPFYVFDEADAALDAENSKKLAKAVKELSKENQFIFITHNNAMIKEADQIIGVSLSENHSSIITLKLGITTS